MLKTFGVVVGTGLVFGAIVAVIGAPTTVGRHEFGAL